MIEAIGLAVFFFLAGFFTRDLFTTKTHGWDDTPVISGFQAIETLRRSNGRGL